VNAACAKFSLESMVLLLALLIFSCDKRASVTRSRPEISFSVDMVVVEDLSQRRSVAEAEFRRNGSLFDDAAISVRGSALTSEGSGSYFSQSPALNLSTGVNQLAFISENDSYHETVAVVLPDSFGTTDVFPRDNHDAQEVLVNWSHSNAATRYLLVVVSRNYPADNTTPFMAVYGSTVNSAIVPDTTFEDPDGFIVDGIYSIYIVAFNQGFGEYDGIPFPLPLGLPQQRISEPSGYLRYGTVAPLDSIIVQL
jgi:hypothetical protein